MSTKSFVDELVSPIGPSGPVGPMGPMGPPSYTCAVYVGAGSSLLHELFDRQAEEWPDRPALEIPPGSGRPDRIVVTYGELAAAAGGIQARLDPVARPDAVVATLLPRTSVHSFAAPLGIMRSGCAFTCIDVAFPDARVSDLLDDSQAL